MPATTLPTVGVVTTTTTPVKEQRVKEHQRVPDIIPSPVSVGLADDRFLLSAVALPKESKKKLDGGGRSSDEEEETKGGETKNVKEKALEENTKDFASLPLAFKGIKEGDVVVLWPGAVVGCLKNDVMSSGAVVGAVRGSLVVANEEKKELAVQLSDRLTCLKLPLPKVGKAASDKVPVNLAATAKAATKAQEEAMAKKSDDDEPYFWETVTFPTF